MSPRPDTIQVSSEAEMLKLGHDFAGKILASPAKQAVFELIGDVGAGKTTFTRGLAEGLGVREPVTSPSFTISKRYAFPIPENCSGSENTLIPENCCKNYNITNGATGQLIHYDFYRLDDPGIMRDELAEALAEPNSVIVVEWGSDVADLLPASKTRLEITLREDGSRTVKIIAANSATDRSIVETASNATPTQPAKDQK